jgi:hypothetical protein
MPGNSIDDLIRSADKFKRLKGGVRQGFIKGDVKANDKIVNILSICPAS